MSVAAQLSSLPRASAPAPFSFAPASTSASLSLSNLAASARNSLTLLSSLDPHIPTFISTLELHTPRIITDVPPSTASRLLAAAEHLLLRLSPVILIRPAHAVVLYLLNVLHVHHTHYNLLLHLLLPHYASPHFQPLLDFLSRAQHAVPYATLFKTHTTVASLTNSLPHSSPAYLLQLSQQLAEERVNTRPIASFLLAALPPHLQNEALAITVLETLAQLPTTETAAPLIATLLLLIAAAIGKSSVKAALVAPVVANVLNALPNDSVYAGTRNTAMATLAVAYRMSAISNNTSDAFFLPPAEARFLLRLSDIKQLLAKLPDTDLRRALYTSLLCASLQGKLRVNVVRLLADVLKSPLLNAPSVNHVLQTLFAVQTPEQDVLASLRDLLGDVAKGRYAHVYDAVVADVMKRARRGKLQKEHAGSLGVTIWQHDDAHGEDVKLPVLVRLASANPGVRKKALQAVCKEQLSEPVFEMLCARIAEDDLDEALEYANAASAVHSNEKRLSVVKRVVERCMKERGGKDWKRGKNAVRALADVAVSVAQEMKDGEFLIALVTGLVSSHVAAVEEPSLVYNVLMSDSSAKAVLPKLQKTDLSSSRSLRQHVTSMITADDSQQVCAAVFQNAAKLHMPWALKLLSDWAKRAQRTEEWRADNRAAMCEFLFTALQCVVENDDLAQDALQLLSQYAQVFIPAAQSKGGQSNSSGSLYQTQWKLALFSKSRKVQEQVIASIAPQVGVRGAVEVVAASLRDQNSPVSLKEAALNWYVNLTALNPAEDVQREAVLFLLDIVCGKLRESLFALLKKIASARVVLSEKKRVRRLPVRKLLSIITKSIPAPLSTFVSAPGSNNLRNVEKAMVTMLKGDKEVQGAGILIATGAKDSDVASLQTFFLELLDGLKDPLCHDALLILRALHGVSLPVEEEEHEKRLDKCFIPALATLQREGLSKVPVEISARLLLAFGSDLKVSARFGKEIITLSRALLSSLQETTEPTNECLRTVVISTIGQCLPHVVGDNNKENVVMEQAMGVLFSNYPASSVPGLCARNLVDSMRGTTVSYDVFERFVRKSITSRPSKHDKKRARKATPGSSRLVDKTTAMGAVSALQAWAEHCVAVEKPFLQPSQCIALFDVLWEYLKVSSSTATESDANMHHYNLVLETVIAVSNASFAQREMRDDIVSDAVDFGPLVNHCFRNLLSDGEGNPLLNVARRLIARLLETLAPFYIEKVATGFCKLLQTITTIKEAPIVLPMVARLLPVIVKAGCDLEFVFSSTVQTAFSLTENTIDSRLELLLPIASLCPQFENSAEIAARKLLSIFVAREIQVSGNVGEVCAQLLEAAQLGVGAEIRLLTHLGGVSKSDDVAAYRLRESSFHGKMLQQMQSADEEYMKAVDNDIVKMFSTLKKDAMQACLQIIPLATEQACVLDVLNNGTWDLKVQTMKCISGHRGPHATQSVDATWSREQTVRMSTMIEFMEKVGEALCVIVRQDDADARKKREMQVVAIGALHFLIDDFGVCDSELTIKLSEVLLKVLQDESQSWAHPAVLESLATVINLLDNRAVSLVGYCLPIAIGILGDVFGRKGVGLKDEDYEGGVSEVGDAAKYFCTNAFMTCAKYCGGKSLRTLAMYVVTTESEELLEVLNVGLQRVPAQTVASMLNYMAMKWEILLRSVSRNGMCLLLDCVINGVKEWNKGEMRMYWRKVVSFMFVCLEVRANLSEHDSISALQQYRRDDMCGKPVKTLAMDWLPTNASVDGKCAELVIAMILKLAETEFEKLFNALVQWMHGGVIPARFGVDGLQEDVVEKTLLRAVPFYRMLWQMLKCLQAIVVPYCMTVVEKIIGHIENVEEAFAGGNDDDGSGSKSKSKSESKSKSKSKRKSKGKSKKRKKMDSDDDDDDSSGGENGEKGIVVIRQVVLSQVELLRSLSLSCLSELLKHSASDGNTLSCNTLTQMLHSLLSAFDYAHGQSSKIESCLAGVCMQTVQLSDKEAMRDLLTTICREVLQRCSSTDAQLRAAGVHACQVVVQYAQEEALVALPEAMPVLSEVIDDEIDSVQRAGVRLIRAFEEVAGEDIMAQIK